MVRGDRRGWSEGHKGEEGQRTSETAAQHHKAGSPGPRESRPGLHRHCWGSLISHEQDNPRMCILPWAQVPVKGITQRVT